MAETTTYLQNIFGAYFDGSKDYNTEITVPSESKIIIDDINLIYQEIYKYFSVSDERDIDRLKETYKLLQDEILSPKYVDMDKGMRNYGNSILIQYKSYNRNSIQSILENPNSYDIDELCNLLFYIIFFTAFPFYSGNNYDKYIGSASEESGYLDDVYELYEGHYRFKENNRFFDLISDILGDDWKTYSGSKTPYGKNKNTYKLLVDGYDEKDGAKKYLFDTVEDINSFILSWIMTSESVLGPKTNWKLDIGQKGLVYILSDKVLGFINDRIDYEEVKYYDSKQRNAILYDFDGIKVKVLSANEYSTYYYNIYKYASNLAINYISILANEGLNETKIRRDPYVQKLFNKIVGTDSNNNGFEAFSGSVEIFDKNNNGNYIFYYLNSKVTTKKKNSELKFDKPNSTIYLGKSDKINYNSISVTDTLYGNAGPFFDALVDLFNSGFEDAPLQFYEVKLTKDGEDEHYNLNDNINNTKSGLQNKIDWLCRMSGNIISKFTFLSFYDIKQTEKPKKNSDTNFSLSSWKTEIKYKNNKSVVFINDENYIDTGIYNYDDSYEKSFENTYNELGKQIYAYLEKLMKVAGKVGADKTELKENAENAAAYDEYVKSRISDSYFTEKDYFYIQDGNKKRIPVNTFIDVEFRVPQYNPYTGKVITAWIPVSAVRSYSKGEVDISLNKYDNISRDDNYSELHAGTYFSSMELNDNGGKKEINLVLKSSNDMNLERIIFNSLSLDSKLKTVESKKNKASYINELINNSESNFRVRFGYRDIASKDASNIDTTITTSNMTDPDFINRARTNVRTDSENNETYVKPVMVYPWTYFKITGLDSSIKSGEDIYTIKGISSGSYIFDNLSICGIPAKFSSSGTTGENIGTPKNVAGKLAKWITMASADNSETGGSVDLTTARICFLGDDDYSIITDFDNDKFTSDYRYELKGGGVLKGGNLESMEDSFFNEANNTDLRAKNFNITNNTNYPSVKKVLDNLIDWLPSRVYYIAKNSEYGTVAVYLPYSEIYKIKNFFSTQPYKTEKLSYQIIEADARIYKSANTPGTVDKNSNTMKLSIRGIRDSESEKFHKVYFIRMYYEGPGRSKSKNGKLSNEYLRIYNYRSLQEQVIEDVEISSGDAELGNTISSVTMLGAGKPLVFCFNREEGTLSDTSYSATNCNEINDENLDIKTLTNMEAYLGDKTGDGITPKFVINNNNYIVSEYTDINDKFDTIESMYTEQASAFFTAMQNKLYTGELTILGDPFYYFDSSVEAGKYEIFLQMNRVEDPKTYKMIPSRYTGIYFITGIKHSIDEEGKYRTTLSITKRIFGSSESSSTNKK